MTRLLLAAIVIAATTSSIYMTVAWWVAAVSPNWSVTLRFGPERWVEGILFHLAALVSLVSIWYFSPYGRQYLQGRKNATSRMAMPKEGSSNHGGVRNAE